MKEKQTNQAGLASPQAGFTLIELLVVMGILAVLLTAVLIAINPSRQFAQARDSQRRGDVLTILNAVQQHMADNKGALISGIPVAPTAPAVISTAGLDICGAISPTYVSILPTDPKTGSPLTGVTACGSAYNTGYTIVQDGSGRVTVASPGKEIGADPISVTR